MDLSVTCVCAPICTIGARSFIEKRVIEVVTAKWSKRRGFTESYLYT